MKIKTLLIGSGVFAARAFEKILKSEKFDIVGLITQPDKPVGRKQILTPPPAKEMFVKSGIDTLIFQPEKLKIQAEEILSITNPEIIIVADYGQFIPNSMLNYPKYKCLNIHGSLLPDLRGAVPIPMAILKGYEETGVSIPIMTPGLDDGDIIADARLKIDKFDTTETLKFKLADLGAELLISKIEPWVKGEIKAIPQNHSIATITYQSDISKDKAQIKNDMQAEEIERMVRAFNPWPIVWGEFELNGKILRVKIFEMESSNDDFVSNTRKIKLIYINKSINLIIDSKLYKVNKIQVEGKEVIEGKNAGFLNNFTLI